VSLLRWLGAWVRLALQSAVLALGQIWANRGRSLLTTIGIVIGVAAVTTVVAALTGLQAKVLEKFAALGTNKIYMIPARPEGKAGRGLRWYQIEFRPEQFEGLREHCPSVAQFTLVATSGAEVRAGDKSIEGVQVWGVQPTWHAIENRAVELGRPFSPLDVRQGGRVCLVTPEVRDKLRLDRDCIGQWIVLAGQSFRVVGVVESRVESAGFEGGGSKSEVVIPFETAHSLWPFRFIFAIATSRSPEVSDEARAELTFFLRQRRGVKPGEPDTFRLEVVEQYLRQFKEVALVITLIAGGIVSISLLVGGVGIMNIMLVSVSERTREIGLRKAVGARPAAILWQFLVEAVMLCLVGGLAGVIGGELLTKLLTAMLAFFTNMKLEQAYIPGWAIVLSFGFAAAVGVFFGMFPAIKAARLDPIEALRHE